MLKVYSKTDIGKVRNSNQDYLISGNFEDGSVWAVVCDGMGGANGGNIASEIAARVISSRLCESYNSDMNADEIEDMFSCAISEANSVVYYYACKNPDLLGMGTTVVAAIVKDKKIFVSHVGDSRAYIINKKEIKQLTHDHSVVQVLIDQGKITQEEAKKDPRKSIITRAVGVTDEVYDDFCECDLKNTDCILICSDGLSNYVEEQCMISELFSNLNDDPAQKLVEIANENGGGDNISVVIICRDKQN